MKYNEGRQKMMKKDKILQNMTMGDDEKRKVMKNKENETKNKCKGVKK
jgi:hypothetical protein